MQTGEPIFDNLLDLVDAIDTSIKHGRRLPALMLIYAGIDIAGWLASSPNEKSVRRSFTNWVNKYMLPSEAFSASALDLYAARCGLLHRYSPDSDLSESQQARRIAYAWGSAVSSDLENSAESLGIENVVAIHISDLFESYRNGIVNFVKEAKSDPQLRVTFVAKAKTTFYPATSDEVLGFIETDVD